jgi:hypothetical protein
MKTFKTIFLLISLSGACSQAHTQTSVARQWNDVLLEAIRKDYARPTVHARNLHHVSIAMYDAWAVYDCNAFTYFLGDTVGNYYCPFNGITMPNNTDSAQNEAISYAAYRILRHRFKNSPGQNISIPKFDTLFFNLGYDSTFTSVDYSMGSPAALGNYIAKKIINYGLQDNSNEQGLYANQFYTPSNPTLLPVVSGNPNITDPNLWQPLSLDVYIDQSGNTLPLSTPEFLSPEWGMVTPFALVDSNLTIHTKNNNDYWVYHDPGPPALLDTSGLDTLSEEYKWGFSLVSIWSSHLDPNDTTTLDISPKSIGNVQSYPTDIVGLRNFYDYEQGGDIGTGHSLNPYTGLSYDTNFVSRGDYGRVLAEFWADGPDSETPPGHWFTLLNHVADHSAFSKQFRGLGDTLSDLEWDVKAYFTLSGALHDAAIAAWGIKGRYDYLRPISAIRYMADKGQCSDTLLMSYNKNGIPLVNDYIELVLPGDILAGSGNINVGKVKLYAWKGPDYIIDPNTDIAGADWILAENWWPYQRPTFVTPPFAGYISGHSTFSRAAAEVLTLFSGDPFFPGGMGQFLAKKDSFLVFEKGPNEDVLLQWATYRDASDQCSLSRIWGGIHPPVDDIPGRLIGEKIGVNAFNFAENYFTGKYANTIDITSCDNFTSPSGKVWNTTNTYIDTIPNNLCNDSIITINLHILNSSTATDRRASCDSLIWIDGNTYFTTNNTATHTLTNYVSCDSLVTLDLNIITTIDTSINQTGNTLSSNQSGANYQWVDCNNGYTPISGETGDDYTPTISGTYAAIIEAGNCIDTSTCINFIISDIFENSIDETTKIYPNPANNYIQVKSNLTLTSIVITDITGKTVKSINYKTQIDIDHLSKGVYIIKLIGEEKTIVRKFIKE